MPATRGVHTEHVILEATIDSSRFLDGTRIFRAPTVLDGSGTHKRLPHEIKPREIEAGDILLVIVIEEAGEEAVVISRLEVWHVKAIRFVGEFDVEYNPIIRAGDYGEQMFDSLAGLLGLPPSASPNP